MGECDCQTCQLQSAFASVGQGFETAIVNGAALTLIATNLADVATTDGVFCSDSYYQLFMMFSGVAQEAFAKELAAREA